uniref:Double-stranded RNA-specific editase Adar n=1 Tax=Glossina morsitans morsitans TaxID=37546 RepID=A0A1B0F9W2_GLOMM
MAGKVDGQKYIGQGRSKKIARIEAAATALRSFIQFKDGAVLTPLKPACNLDFTSDEHLDNDSNKSAISVDSQKKVPDKGPVMLLYELFNDVHFDCSTVDGAQNNCRFKMTVTVNNSKFDGTATANQSIFVRNQENAQYPYKLKTGVHFHLYINTAPCGDARIFSPHENDSGIDKHPNRKARGQLRTKIESGEGTIPVKSSDGIQTWDGVLEGQRLLTMSCSDKIARWNIVGIQGSLLASIVEPIYLHSIVLGSLLHPEHMYRAVCGRIEKSIQGLPPPYHLNKPRLAQVTSSEPRNQAKAPNFGINWTLGDKEVEVVNSLTGKTVNNQISRITKQMFYRKYGNLMKNLPGINERKLTTDYGQTKAKIKDYQIAKRELFAAFRREDLGNWLKKPQEQDEFALPE